MTTQTVDIDKLHLAKGSHATCAEGACFFEAYNKIVARRHTDNRPADVSPVLHTFGMRLNDLLPDDRRQQLKEFLPRDGQPSPLAGTCGDGLDETRGYLALDWLIRTYTPAWLDLAGLSTQARALRDLRRIVDLVAAQSAGLVVRAARDKASAVGDGVRAGVRAAVGDGAWAAAGDGAWAAAGDAARAAAGDAAGDALQPTVDTLQESAIQLYRDMIRIRPAQVGS